MTDIREKCLNNWRNSGHRGRIEQHSFVLEVEGIDVYLDKDLNSSSINIYVVDSSENYSKYSDRYVQKICGERFAYFKPNKFIYSKSLPEPDVISLLEMVSDCKTDFFKYREHFRGKMSYLDELMNMPKNRNLDLAKEAFPKNIFMEITKEEYCRIVGRELPQDFREFVIYGKVINQDYIHVEVYILGNGERLSHVKTNGNEALTSLQDLVVTCGDYVKNFTLNLE